MNNIVSKNNVHHCPKCKELIALRMYENEIVVPSRHPDVPAVLMSCGCGGWLFYQGYNMMDALKSLPPWIKTDFDKAYTTKENSETPHHLRKR